MFVGQGPKERMLAGQMPKMRGQKMLAGQYPRMRGQRMQAG
jgi:hypothetical protein